MPSPHFTLAATGAPGRLILKAYGRLVVGHGADPGRWRACLAPHDANDLLVDLSGVTALDAGGVGVLAGLVDRVTGRGGRVRVVAASPRAEWVLRLAGLASLIASTRRPAWGHPAAA
jgi:ABC-type transporter Mla MlaB component